MSLRALLGLALLLAASAFVLLAPRPTPAQSGVLLIIAAIGAAYAASELKGTIGVGYHKGVLGVQAAGTIAVFVLVLIVVARLIIR